MVEEVGELDKQVHGLPTTPEGSKSGTTDTSETVSSVSSVTGAIGGSVAEMVLQAFEGVQVVVTLVVVDAAMPSSQTTIES